MKKYYDYCEHIEKAMSAYGNDPITFIFKRRTLDEMKFRTKEVMKRGLKDEKVAHDLIIAEYYPKKILRDYDNYLVDLKEKKMIKYTPIVALGCLIASILIFVVIGLIFDLWHPSWLLVEGTASAGFMAIMLTAVSILRRHKKFYALMRVLVAGSIMVGTQFLFLFIRLVFNVEMAYLIFLFALAMMFIGDLILATLTKQRLVFINYLVTIPVVFIFAYVIFGLLGLYTWEKGEPIVFAGFLTDLFVLLGMLLNNRRYMHKPEVEDTWKEN